MEITGLYFTAENFNTLYDELNYIAEKMRASGYRFTFNPKKITWAYNPTEIINLFNLHELNLSNIDEGRNSADWINPYTDFYKWERKNENIYDKINRWANWNKFALKVINGEEQKTKYLVDSSGEKILNYKGDPILVYDGYFGKE